MSPLTSVSASRIEQLPDRFKSLWTYARDKSTLPSASSSPPTCWPRWSSPTEAYHLIGGDFSFITGGHHEDPLGSLFCRDLNWVSTESGDLGRSRFRTR